MVAKCIHWCILVICLSFHSNIYAQASFKFLKLNVGTKTAIEDYGKKYDNYNMLALLYLNKHDTDSFSLVGNIGMIQFIISPPMYYSLVNGRVILIYNGEEKSYIPSPTDMDVMFDFLSNFTETKDFINCDWEKKVIQHNPFLIGDNRFLIYDPPIINYHISQDTIISSEFHYGEGGYPDQRIRYEFIMKKE